MMIWGQSRYFDYEVGDCSECEPVFPQGCQLIRLLDSQCSYYEIAKAPGVYDWSKLDKQLDACELHHCQVLYCFCYTPEWAYRTDWVPEWPEPGIATPHSNYPPRIDVFEEFVRALLIHTTRSDGSNRIQYLEAWNETNALGFWNGNYDHLMEQQQVIWNVSRELAPAILITTPTPTWNFTTADSEIDQFLQRGFSRYAHLISFHGYCPIGSPAEAIVPRLEAVRAAMSRNNCGYPLWDTEWNWTQGYPDDGSIPMSQVPQWIKDSLIYRLQNNIAAAIWHEWDNPNGCGYCIGSWPSDSDPQWHGHVNPAGHAWIDCYDAVHPLPAVYDLQVVGTKSY